MQPNTHSSALCCTKYQGNWEQIVLWRTEPQFQAVQFRCITAAILGLDQSKQSSQAAMATLYHVACTCYPCFGPSGSWRTSVSLDTGESPVLPKELGCTSCCFGTESAFQHWRNNQYQTQESIQAGSMDAPLVRKGYCRELWPICHHVPCMKSPN